MRSLDWFLVFVGLLFLFHDKDSVSMNLYEFRDVVFEFLRLGDYVFEFDKLHFRLVVRVLQPLVTTRELLAFFSKVG